MSFLNCVVFFILKNTSSPSCDLTFKLKKSALAYVLAVLLAFSVVGLPASEGLSVILDNFY